jgi:hypothetical protein
MTTQLAPLPIFKAFDNSGAPLAFGYLYTYEAGTTTPQATYTDSTGSAPNQNPIQLNARGETPLWLNPELNYKFLLTDSLGNTIPGWPVDNISGSLYPGQSIIPNTSNAYTLGSPQYSWANLYLGPNNVPVLNNGVVGYWPQTSAEQAANITPTNFYVPSHLAEGDIIVERYGADPTGTNDSGAAFRAACSVASELGGGRIVAEGALYLFNTWDATSFYAGNNLALFLLPANTELAGGGQFFTKLRISQIARTGMYDGGANRTHILGMPIGAGGQYVHDVEFDYDGIVQASAADFCYFARTMAGQCIFERCYGVQGPITNAIVDSSTDTAHGASPLGPTIVRDCWFQDCGPNMTGNSAINADQSYLYLAAPGSRADHNRLFNSAIANHNCGGIEMHASQYYASGNFIKNCWPAMYIGVDDGVTISVGSVVESNYFGYNNTGISIVDQHTGLKIVKNHFEANCDSAGSPNGYLFTDLYTPLNSNTGVNSAGIQTGILVSQNTFDMTLFRQGTARASAGTSTNGANTSINLSALTGASVDHNTFIGAPPACIEINGTVTGATQSACIEENTLIACTDAAGTNAYILINMSSGAGYASAPAARDVFVRRNHLWRSTAFAKSVANLAIALGGGAGPAGTLTNVQFEDNDCDNVSNTIDTLASLTAAGQVAFNGKDQFAQALTANGQTLSTLFKKLRVTSGAAFTGLIMQAGTYDGQECTVVNENSSAQTMAAAGTSNVANGTSCVIAGSTSMRFVWDAAPALWYANP